MTCAWARSTPGWRGTSRAATSSPPMRRTPGSPGSSARGTRLGHQGPRRAAHPPPGPARHRRLERGRRRRPRARRLAAHRRAGRRPAGVARRAGVRPARAWPRSPSAPAGCSTCASGPSRRSPTARARPARSRSSPGAGTGRRCGASRPIMLAAGTNVEWLRDDLGVIDTAEQSHDVAAECETTDGVVYVPALLGPGHAPVGLRRPRRPVRHHARDRPAPGRPSGARGRGPTRRRPGRGRRGRHRPGPRPAPHRRRHERQPDVRAGRRRRHRAARRGVARTGGDDARRRVPRRARHRHLVGLGRDRGHVAPVERRRARPGPRPRAVARGCRPGRRVGARSRARSNSDAATYCHPDRRFGHPRRTHGRFTTDARDHRGRRRPRGGGGRVRRLVVPDPRRRPARSRHRHGGRDARRGVGRRGGRGLRGSRATGRSTRRSARSTTSRAPGPATASRRSWPASARTPPSAARPT